MYLVEITQLVRVQEVVDIADEGMAREISRLCGLALPREVARRSIKTEPVIG